MGDESGLTPDERHQAELRRAAAERDQQTKALALKIFSERGPEFESRAEREGVDDPQQRKLVAEAMAGILAARETEPVKIFHHDERGLVDAAIPIAEELSRRQEQAAETANKAQPEPTPEITSSQQREAEEARKQQLLNTAEELRLPPARTAIEQYDRAVLALGHVVKEFAAKGDTGAQQLLNDRGQTLGTQDSAAAAWVAQADSLDRQQHQHGRYDALRGGPNPPGGGGANPTPPQAPSSPTPPTPKSGPLSANDVLQRFGNPELEARYQQQEQRREQDAKSSSSLQTPDTPARAAARGNAPAEKAQETDLRAFFSTAAIKKRAEEAEAARANDPTYTQGQGRGGGRSR